MKDLNEYYVARIEALENENIRLNKELKRLKKAAFKAKVSDPNFNKPLSEIETIYKIIKK